MAMFDPPPTGDFVKREIVEARGLTVTRVAPRCWAYLARRSRHS